MSLHLPILLIYAAVLMGIGLWVGRRVHRSSEFFVAGRRLGPWLLFATMLTANIGTGSTVGAAGLGYRTGSAPGGGSGPRGWGRSCWRSGSGP